MTILEPNPPQTPEIQPNLRGSFVYEGITVDPQELFDRYATSPLGVYHAKQPARYTQSYAYDPSKRSIIADLGDDVHPVKHMKHTHDEITVPFLEAQRNDPNVPQFTPKQEAELRTTAMLHDIGECTSNDLLDALGFTVGDAEYGCYDQDYKVKEEAIRNHIFKQHYPDVPQTLLDKVNQIDGRETDDIQTRAFEVIERIGYFETGIRAARIILAEKTSFDEDHSHQTLLRTAQLGRLAIVVVTNHRPFLESQANEFAYVKNVLAQAA